MKALYIEALTCGTACHGADALRSPPAALTCLAALRSARVWSCIFPLRPPQIAAVFEFAGALLLGRVNTNVIAGEHYTCMHCGRRST